jgi:hypothetical protein
MRPLDIFSREACTCDYKQAAAANQDVENFSARLFFAILSVNLAGVGDLGVR